MVAEILDMEKKRLGFAAKKGFDSWSQRFSESFDETTSPKDLSDSTLGKLIQPGEDSSMAIYEFVMGVMGLGKGPRFYFLENPDKMVVMDITLFLLDQLRFEAMRRVGWVEEFPTASVPLVALVKEFPNRYSALKHQAPPLLPSHHLYDDYQKTFEADLGVFIRRLIPDVLQVFQPKSQP